MGRGLFIAHLVDAKTEIRRFGMSGRPAGIVTLPGIATAGGFQGRPRDSEAFFGFTAFAAPTAVHQHDTEINAVERNASNKPDDITVEQRIYRSKDWTEVPIFNVRRKDVTIAARYCFVATGASEFLGFLCQPDPPRLGVAGRGFGNRLHPRWWRIRGSLASRAGEVANKQNSFYDFIAAEGASRRAPSPHRMVSRSRANPTGLLVSPNRIGLYGCKTGQALSAGQEVFLICLEPRPSADRSHRPSSRLRPQS